MLVIVVLWSFTPTFYFLYVFSALEGALILFLRKFVVLKHCANLKKSHKQKQERVFSQKNNPVYLEIEFTDVGFLVINGFGVFSRE